MSQQRQLRRIPRQAPVTKPPRVRRRLRTGGLYRWMRRFRIPLAVLLGVCAAAAALLAGEHSTAETTVAVRVTADVAAGDVLSAAVLEETEIDAAAVPGNHPLQMEDLLGETVAVALPAGALVNQTQLVGPGLLQGRPAGTVAVPVRPADTAIIGLLSPGQRVDVTASSDAPGAQEGSQRIAEAAPVLWIPQDESENWLGASSDARNVVILAVDAATAAQIAEASHSGRLHLTLVSGAD